MTTSVRPKQIFFLPGASGRKTFWLPVSDLLQHPGVRVHFEWPGFGSTPADPAVDSIDDLARMVIARIDKPTAIVAQSMGGVIAMLAALERPSLVTQLVLTATSGGIALDGLGAQDWRPLFRAANPGRPQWFIDCEVDLTAKLSAVRAPTLLLWGDADPVSPVAVGKRLAAVLPKAELHVLPGGTHDLANEFAHFVAPLIDRHFAKTG